MHSYVILHVLFSLRFRIVELSLLSLFGWLVDCLNVLRTFVLSRENSKSFKNSDNFWPSNIPSFETMVLDVNKFALQLVWFLSQKKKKWRERHLWHVLDFFFSISSFFFLLVWSISHFSISMWQRDSNSGFEDVGKDMTDVVKEIERICRSGENVKGISQSYRRMNLLSYFNCFFYYFRSSLSWSRVA